MLRKPRLYLSLDHLESRTLASDTLLGVICSPRWGSLPGAWQSTAASSASAPELAIRSVDTLARDGWATADHNKVESNATPVGRRLADDHAAGSPAGWDEPAGDFIGTWPDVLPLAGQRSSCTRAGRMPRLIAGSYLPSSPADRSAAAMPQTAPGSHGLVAAAQPTPATPGATAAWADLQAAALAVQVLPAQAVAPAPLSRDGHGGNPPPPGANGYQVSWHSGTYDTSGNFMGATEVMQLVPYKGMLFAGTSCWDDVPGKDPVVGAQVLRLDGPHDSWQVDADFTELLPDGKPRYIRVGAMSAVTFTHDGDGNPLPEPVSMLLAAPSDQLGVDVVYSRNDDTGTWTPMVLAKNPIPGGIRAIGFYQDSVTGVDRVFAGSAAAGLFTGVYDPKAPGRIRWEADPEVDPRNRFMAFTVADGAFYTVVQPAMYRRTDGPKPSWDAVYTYPPPPLWASGLRGLTTIANPTGDNEALLAGKEGLVSVMDRFDPDTGYQPVVELYVQSFLRQQWGSGFGLLNNYLVVGYNDIPQYTDPRTGENVNLVTMLAQSPNPDQANSAWFLVRHANAQYDLHEVPPLPTPNNPDPSLRATRSIVVSPFPEDRGKVFYLSGYDVSEMPSHNTGWIYRGSLDAVLGPASGGHTNKYPAL
jgi:hypothetical protein